MSRQALAARAVIAVVAGLVAALAMSGVASAKTHRFRAYAERGGIFYFHVRGVDAQDIRSGRLVSAGSSRRLSAARLRAAARAGKLRARAPRRVYVALRRKKLAFGAGATAKLVITTRKPQKGGTAGSGSGSTTGSTGSTTGTGTTTGSGTTSMLPTGSCDSSAPAFGSFGVGTWPGGCWRPYADTSPFNRLIPASPRVAANSNLVVQRMLGFGPLQHLLAGQAGTSQDAGHPTYWPQPQDPWFTLHCTEAWGRCQFEGERIQVPDRARAASGSDGHMTVVEQSTGWEYDFWGVQSKPAGGGQLDTRWGGKTRIDGDGLGAQANAANFGEMAGNLRVEELQAGQINHALFLAVNCDSGASVYPASHLGRSCSDIGLSNANAPAMGQRFQLSMSDAEIDALAVPPWKKTILRAMAHYGMYVGDTGGTWGIKDEGGDNYTSFGLEDKWVAYAKQVGVPYYAPDNDWVFNLRDGVDWAHRLRVIDPCEANATC